MEAVLVLVLLGALVVARLGWLAWKDRKRAEAEQVGAAIRWAVNRRLRGESFLSVQVTPRTLWHAGRVILSAPSGCERLVEEVWSALVEHLPASYEFVVRLPRPRTIQGRGQPREQPRAA